MTLKWSYNLFGRRGATIFVLLLTVFGASQVWADDPPTISITVRQAPPDYVASGDDINAKLQVHLIDPKTGNEVHPLGTTFAWSNPWNKKDGVVTTTGGVQLTADAELQVEDVKATFAAGGVYTIDVKVVAHNDNWTPKDLTAEATLTSTVVELKSIAPTDGGATQTNVLQNVTVGNTTYANNWAVVKGDGTVTIQATLIPDTDAAAVVLTWQGGDAVPGKPRQRTVSKGTSATTYVKATCGTASADLYLWVVWATITSKTDQTTKESGPDPAKFGPFGDGTENLGVQYNKGKDSAWGKLSIIAKIEPAGVNKVITSGWDIVQNRTNHTFRDGAKQTVTDPGQPSPWDDNWKDDSGGPDVRQIKPDTADQIYYVDGPNIANFSGYSKDSEEVYCNFIDNAIWNNTRCSDFYKWSWTGWWKNDPKPFGTVTKADLQTGQWIPGLPETANYEPPAP